MVYLAGLGWAEGGRGVAVSSLLAYSARCCIQCVYIWRLVLPTNVASPSARRHSSNAIFSPKKQQCLNKHRTKRGGGKQAYTDNSLLPPSPSQLTPLVLFT